MPTPEPSSRYVYLPRKSTPQYADEGFSPAQKLQESCFDKCVPKPGTSISSGEQTCLTTCMEKYMAAWNQVNSAYINRIRQDHANQ